MGRCTARLDVLYSHAEVIKAWYLLRIDVLVRTGTSELGTGLLRLLHEQIARERGDISRSEDTAMAIERRWYGGHGSLRVITVYV